MSDEIFDAYEFVQNKGRQGMDWNQEVEMGEIDAGKFEDLADEIFKIREQRDKVKAELRLVEKELDSKSNLFMAYMEKYNKKEHAGRMGKISMKRETYPSAPKDYENKQKFFNYLKEKGVYDDYITVNPSALRSFYNSEKELHEDNPDWEMPGIVDPHSKMKISARRKK